MTLRLATVVVLAAVALEPSAAWLLVMVALGIGYLLALSVVTHEDQERSRMPTEGWCRACGTWMRVDSTWKLPRHEWYDPQKRRKVRCSGSNKRPGQTRPT